MQLLGDLIMIKIINESKYYNRFMADFGHAGFNEICSRLQDRLPDVPVGVTWKFRDDNSYHDCMTIIKKVGEDEYLSTYVVDGKVAWETRDSTKKVASDIANYMTGVTGYFISEE